MENYVPRLYTVDPQADHPPNQRADIELISTSLPNPGGVTLIDINAHNRQHGGTEFSVGAAAILRAQEKPDMYNRSFDFSSDAVRLAIFPVETSGGGTPVPMLQHNPGLQLSNILNTLSVAVQTAHAKCVVIVTDRLTLDTVPIVPFINGLIPVPPPVSFNLPIDHVRYDALTPPLMRPAPTARLPPPSPSPPPFPPGAPPVSFFKSCGLLKKTNIFTLS